MVVVYVRTTENVNEWKRESFLDPQHYMKWCKFMGKRIVDIKPVGKRVKRAW